jgi:ribonuclease-3
VAKENGLERPSLLADAFEAVVAAIYLERGYDVAKAFVHDALAQDVAAAAQQPGDVDPKARLRQWSEANGHGTPVYKVTSTGPSHDVTYYANVEVTGLIGRGEGRSKKSAEASAAEDAWEQRA